MAGPFTHDELPGVSVYCSGAGSFSVYEDEVYDREIYWCVTAYAKRQRQVWQKTNATINRQVELIFDYLLNDNTHGNPDEWDVPLLKEIDMPKLSDWFADRPKESHKCDDCKGAGCSSCGGFGWDFNDDACLLSATGNHNSCPKNAKCK